MGGEGRWGRVGAVVRKLGGWDHLVSWVGDRGVQAGRARVLKGLESQA